MNARVVSLLICCTTLALAGCSDGTQSDPPPQEPVPQPDAGCTAEYPDRLGLVTDIPDEEQYHDETIVCGNSDLSAATLKNGSGVVFAFYSDDGEATVDVQTSELDAEVFHDEADAMGLQAGSFAAPGDVAVLASPSANGVSGIEWHVHPELTSAWLVQETILGRLQTLTQATAVDLLASGSKGRKAVATCAFAGGHTAQAVEDLTNGSDAFFDAFAVAAATSPCATAWRTAEQELGTTRWPTLADNFQTGLFAAEEVTALRSKVSWVSKWISVFVGAAR